MNSLSLIEKKELLPSIRVYWKDNNKYTGEMLRKLRAQRGVGSRRQLLRRRMKRNSFVPLVPAGPHTFSKKKTSAKERFATLLGVRNAPI